MRECPKCLGITTVLQTRENTNGETRRRRLCIKCKFRFTTIEVLLDYYWKINGKKLRKSTALQTTQKRN